MPRAAGTSGRKQQIDGRLWWERDTQTAGEFYSVEDTTAIKRAMLGSEDAWIDTIAEGKGSSTAIWYPTYDYGPDYSSPWNADTRGLTINVDPYGNNLAWGELPLGERQQVEAYWRTMQEEAGARYWDIQWGEPDAEGLMFQVFTPLRMATWNIENDGENWGWNDAMIGEVQRRLALGPEFLRDQEGVEGLFGEQPRTGGGGGGGRARGPVYIGPDRGVVEDTVKALLTSLTGDEPEALVQTYADMWEAAHRQDYDVRVSDSGGDAVDPNQTVLEAIREQDDYKRIHELRGEGESETRWISDRQSRLTQLGVSSQTADDRAVWLAQTGTNLSDIRTGALQNARGMRDITLMGKIKAAATMVAGQL